MIPVESATKTYGKLTAVDGVSFTASPGRVTGFPRPHDAGKSTTMRVIVGLTPRDLGRDARAAPSATLFRRRSSP